MGKGLWKIYCNTQKRVSSLFICELFLIATHKVVCESMALIPTKTIPVPCLSQIFSWPTLMLLALEAHNHLNINCKSYGSNTKSSHNKWAAKCFDNKVILSIPMARLDDATRSTDSPEGMKLSTPAEKSESRDRQSVPLKMNTQENQSWRRNFKQNQVSCHVWFEILPDWHGCPIHSAHQYACQICSAHVVTGMMKVSCHEANDKYCVDYHLWKYHKFQRTAWKHEVNSYLKFSYALIYIFLRLSQQFHLWFELGHLSLDCLYLPFLLQFFQCSFLSADSAISLAQCYQQLSLPGLPFLFHIFQCTDFRIHVQQHLHG